jgi:LmbE family N-acetylglucosaminyl deacetylase
MIEKLIIEETDSVAIIAPHPDDECLGVASALLRFPEKTDVYVLTDGSWGNKERSIEEEAVVRKKQFEAEMAYAKPRRYEWIGVEDTKLKKHYEAADKIDFTQYTKVFLPWHESLHPDHRAAADMCCRAIRAQKATPECFSYEVNAPFHRPTHYVDITDIVEEKRKLIRFHEDQVQQEDITMSLNAFRAAQLIMKPEVKSAECFLKIDAYEKSYNNDVLMKLHKFKEDFGLYERLEEQGIRIKCVIPCDITPVHDFIEENFTKAWADEALPAMMNGTCYIAVKGRKIIAFGCGDATAKCYVGPCGTLEEARGLGLYRAIVQRILRQIKEKGYRYAIVGMAAPAVKGILKDLADGQDIIDSKGSYDDLLIRINKS